MPQDDDLSIFERQCHDRLANSAPALPDFERLARIIRSAMVIRERLLGKAAAPGVEALVDEDPVDPAEEPVLRVVCIEPLVNLDERILGGIPRILVVAEQ